MQEHEVWKFSTGVPPPNHLTTRSLKTTEDQHKKKLSCCCDSRSYCVPWTLYWHTITLVSVTRSDSMGRVYERTQTLSTQAV